jgi:flagella basal body P-ring formation protein FlgA
MLITYQPFIFFFAGLILAFFKPRRIREDKMRKYIPIFLCFFSHMVFANQIQSIPELRASLHEFSQQMLNAQKITTATVKIGTIDSRLKLKQCPKDKLKIFIPYQKEITKTSTLGIKCSYKSTKWTLYVPLSIKIVSPVVVSKHFIPAGNLITENDIQLIEKNTNKIKLGYFKVAKRIVGTVAKRNIARGKIITPSDLKLANLIHKGERVIISALSNSIKVSMKGVAINSGTLGDIIRVKNLSSKRVIEAKIVARGKVEVNI